MTIVASKATQSILQTDEVYVLRKSKTIKDVNDKDVVVPDGEERTTLKSLQDRRAALVENHAAVLAEIDEKIAAIEAIAE